MSNHNPSQTKEQARDTAGYAAKETKDSAKKMAEETRHAWSQAKEEPTPTGIQGALENLPAPVYLYATFGSMAASLLLRLMGKREFANFIGLWPPTIVALAMMNKSLRPSREM